MCIRDRVYCGQMVGWIRMPLGTAVGLGPGDIVLDDPAPPKGTQPHPQFSTHVGCGQTARWIKMPIGTEVWASSQATVLDGDPAPPSEGAQQLPTFRPMSIVAKRSPISATAELLLCLMVHQKCLAGPGSRSLSGSPCSVLFTRRRR